MRRLAIVLASFLFACEHNHDDATLGDDGHDHGAQDDHPSPVDTVVLTPEAVAAARIEVRPAEVGTLRGELTLPGRIALDPRKEAVVSAWIAGQVDAIYVRTGDTVSRRASLGSVQSPELGEAIAAFRAAKARDGAEEARLDRLRTLVADGVASRSQLLEAEAAHAEVEGMLEAAEERLRILGVDPSIGDPTKGEHYVSRVRVRSPIAGTVLSTNARIGQRVAPGEMLFHVGDLSEVWLLADVFEADLAQVATGQAVRFSVPAWPGEDFEGRVAQVGSWVEPESRTVEVRVVVDNPAAKLMPNMFASARISVASGDLPRGVVLPLAAVQDLDGHAVVFVEEAPGRFKVRPVEVAQQTPDQLRLESGLQAGEAVVTTGAFALKSELEKGELGDGHAH